MEAQLVESPLKIALDVWGTGCSEPRGVAYHKRQYAQACALLAQAGLIQLTYVGVSEDYRWLKDRGLLQYGKFRVFRIPGRLQQLLTNFSFLPFAWLIGIHDVFHSFTMYPFQAGRMQVIGTLFDFVPMRVPEYSSLTLALEQTCWCHWAGKHPQAKWIANSEHTRKDALAIARLRPEQVQVVNLCADDDFYREPSPKSIKNTLAEFGIKLPYLMCVNTLNPRKNHLRLLEAWQKGEFFKQGWMLVLVGHAASNPLAERLEAGEYEGVTWLGYVSRAQQVDLYHGCEALLYPSLYEGFGIAVAEAIVCGKPLLVSQRSPMADVAGEGAILVDPLDVNSIQDGLARLIGDSELRTLLGNQNSARKQEFSIKNMAANLLSAYQDCIR